MPELPEVEIFRRFIDCHTLNERIQAVTVRHPKGLRDLSPGALERLCVQHRFTETLRRGKYLLAKLEPANALSKSTPTVQAPWLLFHFGMTGCLSYTASTGHSINAYGDAINRDAHSRVSFSLGNSGQLHFHDQRLFGYISAIDHPEAFFESKQLGPDALSISQREFLARLQHKTGTLKPLLMNQAVLAGLGNIYVDELLFQCKLHPAQPVTQLPAVMLKHLHQEMQSILNNSIRLDTDRDALPAHYLWHQRHPKGHCPRDGHPFQIETVGGRTTYFCPHCQKLKRTERLKKSV